MFNTSDYPEDNIHGMPRLNKKIPLLFKDENNEEIMSEICALKSRMYITRVQGRDSIKRAKGVKKYALRNSITFEDYYHCLMRNSTLSLNQNSIRCKSHSMYTVSQKKIALNASDDKRVVQPDGVNTLPYGHYSI